MALIEYHVEGGVAIIEFNNPPANAYTFDSLKQLDQAIITARFDPGVQVMVLCGSGEV